MAEQTGHVIRMKSIEIALEISKIKRPQPPISTESVLNDAKDIENYILEGNSKQ